MCSTKGPWTIVCNGCWKESGVYGEREELPRKLDELPEGWRVRQEGCPEEEMPFEDATYCPECVVRLKIKDR